MESKYIPVSPHKYHSSTLYTGSDTSNWCIKLLKFQFIYIIANSAQLIMQCFRLPFILVLIKIQFTLFVMLYTSNLVIIIAITYWTQYVPNTLLNIKISYLVPKNISVACLMIDLPKSPLLFQDFHQFTLELLVELYLLKKILSVNLLSNLKQMKNVAPCQEIWKHMLCFLDTLIFSGK